MTAEPHHIVSGDEFLHHVRRRSRLITAVVAGALYVVVSDPPHRLDLWVAEFAGTAMVIAALPLIVMRLFAVRDSLPVLALGIAVAVALAHATPVPQERDSGRLPTASDGFGAYTRVSEPHRNS